VGLPSLITFTDGSRPRPQIADGAWGISDRILRTVGLKLRDALYLPRMKQNLSKDLIADQRLAEQYTQALRNPDISCSKKLKRIRDHFTVRDTVVRLEGTIVRLFTIRLFESRGAVSGKKLCVIIFCYNGNSELTDLGESRSWNPLTIDEVSSSPLSVLRAVQSCGIRVDSLFTHSLGNLIFDGLKYLPSGVNPLQVIPPTVVINRGSTSVAKVGNRLFLYPLCDLLYGAASVSGWNADAEQELLNFCERTAWEGDPSQHEVVMIEAKEDHYFSGDGSFAANIHETIAALGLKIFRGQFWAFPYHQRSHHAMPLKHFVNNSETELVCHSPQHFPLCPDEKMPNAIANNIFFRGEGEWHTSYCTGVADDTLDTCTMRTVMPLLNAFIQEGEKREKPIFSEILGASVI
jgi:hypothetical protein